MAMPALRPSFSWAPPLYRKALLPLQTPEVGLDICKDRFYHRYANFGFMVLPNGMGFLPKYNDAS
jgi:hypothetical protein